MRQPWDIGGISTGGSKVSDGNVKADKEKSIEKIDGAVAIIMVFDRAIRCGNSNIRFTMTAVFCLYNFRIFSLKCAILLRELSLISLTFPLFYGNI